MRASQTALAVTRLASSLAEQYREEGYVIVPDLLRDSQVRTTGVEVRERLRGGGEGRAVATKKKLVRPKYEECEKKNDGKSCEARQAVGSTALLQLGVWGAL